MKKVWDSKKLAKLKRYYPVLPTIEVAEKLGMSYAQVKTAASRYKLTKRGKLHSWSYKDEQQLIELYPTTKVSDLAKLFGKTESAIGAAAYKLGLKTLPEYHREWSSKGFFKKGSTPKNKGKKITEYCSQATINKIKKTQFTKGNIPANHKPIGSERITKDGYREIKTKEPNKWEALHRLNWERVNGEIPKGMVLVFKGDKMNADPENCELITRQENMKRNTYHNYPKEIAQLVQLRGALTRQINKAKKRYEKQD